MIHLSGYSASRQDLKFLWVPVGQAECWLLPTGADQCGYKYNPDEKIQPVTD